MKPKSAIKEIIYWQSKFRVLKDWDIVYEHDAPYKGQSSHNVKAKLASIYEWPQNNLPQAIDYLIHEVLHVAYRAARAKGRRGEEEFIQDLCATMLASIPEHLDAIRKWKPH